jgi:hypothetical protein
VDSIGDVRTLLSHVRAEVKAAEDAAKDEVWSGYRFVVLSDSKAASGLKIIDLGAGHASASETLSGRVIGALKTEGLLNESVGASYVDRHWPPAFKDTGAWPLASLRQSFLNGTLTRLLDPDRVLKTKIAEFVKSGEFGFASGVEPAGGFRRIWARDEIDPADVAFEADVYLITKALAEKLRSPDATPVPAPPSAQPEPPPIEPDPDHPRPEPGKLEEHTIIRVSGSIPPEQWNRLGTRLIPKMRGAGSMTATIRLEGEVDTARAVAFSAELQQVIDEIGLSQSVRVERGPSDT